MLRIPCKKRSLEKTGGEEGEEKRERERRSKSERKRGEEILLQFLFFEIFTL